MQKLVFLRSLRWLQQKSDSTIRQQHQFLPQIYAVTTMANHQGTPPLLVPSTHSSYYSSLQDDQWTSLSHLVLADELQPTLVQMSQENWPLPQAGYELINDRGTIIAEAELAWPESNVAIVPSLEDRKIYTQSGWFALTVAEFLHRIDTVKEKL